MITAKVDTSGFEAGMRGLIEKVGIESRVVVAKETGELIKTLVKTSPPADPAKTRKKIQEGISAKFEAAADEHLSGKASIYDGKTGPSGIKWYRVDQQFLRGVAESEDKRKASVEELMKLRFRLTKKGRRNLSFRFPRKHQRVLISQTTLTKASTVKKLIARTQQHVGRLKAAWLAAVTAGVIRISGANLPPQWVTRHTSGAQGTYIDGLATPKSPTFTIINRAKGIGQKQVDGIVQNALNIRAKAMAKNMALFLSGKKKLSDYAKNL